MSSLFFFLMIRRPPRSTLDRSSAASDVYKRQGDVNGDGYADVLVGVPNYDNGQTDEGAAFIYFGGAGAFNTFLLYTSPSQRDRTRSPIPSSS